MLMAVIQTIGSGRKLGRGEAFLADVQIVGGVARFYQARHNPKEEPRAISPKIRVVRHDKLGTHEVLGGLVVVSRTHPDPAIGGKETVYHEWEMQPRWEPDYARDYRIMLPNEKPPTAK